MAVCVCVCIHYQSKVLNGKIFNVFLKKSLLLTKPAFIWFKVLSFQRVLKCVLVQSSVCFCSATGSLSGTQTELKGQRSRWRRSRTVWSVDTLVSIQSDSSTRVLSWDSSVFTELLWCVVGSAKAHERSGCVFCESERFCSPQDYDSQCPCEWHRTEHARQASSVEASIKKYV